MHTRRDPEHPLQVLRAGRRAVQIPRVLLENLVQRLLLDNQPRGLQKILHIHIGSVHDGRVAVHLFHLLKHLPVQLIRNECRPALLGIPSIGLENLLEEVGSGFVRKRDLVIDDNQLTSLESVAQSDAPRLVVNLRRQIRREVAGVRTMSDTTAPSDWRLLVTNTGTTGALLWDDLLMTSVHIVSPLRAGGSLPGRITLVYNCAVKDVFANGHL